MPYPGVPSSLTPKMEKCVRDVMAKGHDKSSAIAICHTSLMGKKEFIYDGWLLDNGVVKEVSNEGVIIEKEADGRYKIMTISTAAVKDLVGETVDAGGIDYDAEMAELTGEYPEYRLFHKEALPIGRVEKMYRVGIFAVDEGHSYTDPFSLAVCEKMLANNDGTWRCSRGFWAIEASGACPQCGSKLLLRQKHMIAGFACPTCKSIHANFKGVLKEVHFRKIRTFDVTITDRPCVPFTGASATKVTSLEDKPMTKKELKERLLKAGVEESVVDAKLATVTDEQLKEYDGIPEATLLKEFDDEPAGSDGDEPTFVLDDSVLKAFGEIVREEVAAQLKEALDGISIDIPADQLVLKEAPDVIERLDRMEAMLKALTSDDATRLKSLAGDAPRNADGRLRVMRFKAAPPPKDDEETEEEAEGEEEPMPMMPKGKKPMTRKEVEDGVMYNSDGTVVRSVSEFILGGK